MNPLNWKHEHQVALGIAAVIGAVLGVLTGYLVYAIVQGADGAMSFGRWVEYSLWAAALLWAIVGLSLWAAALTCTGYSGNKILRAN